MAGGDRQNTGHQERVDRAALLIVDQHRELDRLQESIRIALDRGEAAAIDVDLARFRGLVEAHFELEERVYYPTRTRADLAQVDRSASFTSEHADLREELAALCTLAKSGGDSAELIASFEDFLAALQEHERREEAWMVGQTREP